MNAFKSYFTSRKCFANSSSSGSLLAGFVARWWNAWKQPFSAAGGRADEWRFRVELPPIVAKLDRAAGLDHRELTGRSLYLGQT